MNKPWAKGQILYNKIRCLFNFLEKVRKSSAGYQRLGDSGMKELDDTVSIL